MAAVAGQSRGQSRRPRQIEQMEALESVSHRNYFSWGRHLNLLVLTLWLPVCPWRF